MVKFYGLWFSNTNVFYEVCNKAFKIIAILWKMNWKHKPGGIKSDVNKQIITSQNFIVLENQIQTFWDIREKRQQ